MAAVQVKASKPGLYPIPVSLRAMVNGAGVGILVTLPLGVTASFTVLVSGDDPTLPGAPQNWNPHDTLGTTQTASANGNLQYPCTFVGLNIASVSGGSVVMNVVQPNQGS